MSCSLHRDRVLGVQSNRQWAASFPKVDPDGFYRSCSASICAPVQLLYPSMYKWILKVGGSKPGAYISCGPDE